MNTQHTPSSFARRGRDGLAHIGPTRFDILGVRFFTDDQGTAGAAAGSGTAEQGAAGAQQQTVATPPWGDDPSKFDPDKAWTLIQNVKGDLAEYKTKSEAAIVKAAEEAAEKAKRDTLAEFGRLLTGETAPETDPVKLNESLSRLRTESAETSTKLTAAEAQVKAGQIALQVAIHAPGLGGNVPVLLANEQFKTSIASVEPTDEAAIKAAITKALQDNAALKQPPRQSGTGEHTGPTVQSLESLLAAAEKSGDAAESITLKRRIAELKARS
ncbi:MAG: hypothetical protein JSS52_11260 [Proteobacteria bacterium]|nr:hypothetical protein [Pseudomonadota bacterium]